MRVGLLHIRKIMLVICYYFKRLCYIQEEYASLVCVGISNESLFTPARLLLVTTCVLLLAQLLSVTHSRMVLYCPIVHNA